ncbi:uncharacterized protein LOC134839862 [Symsagittifera roscoffensis]|uniref:uncharacterized protein LOC134839862 n=1 Tax=Symsagittifera roscoffensis TaxID=84072 RepID=UPI00307C4EAC
MSFRNILIAIDGTTESQHALNYYAHFFYKPQDDITIIVHGSSGGQNMSKLLDETYGFSGGYGIKDAFKKIVSDWAKEHHIEEYRIHVVFATSESEPGKFICSYSSNHQVECILVPCHGVALHHKPLKVSKVQEYVLKNAEQPVLVVPLHFSRMLPDCFNPSSLHPPHLSLKKSKSASPKRQVRKM